MTSFFEEGLESDGSTTIAELEVIVCLVGELKNQLQFLITPRNASATDFVHLHLSLSLGANHSP